jgi:hypothetical protein
LLLLCKTTLKEAPAVAVTFMLRVSYEETSMQFMSEYQYEPLAAGCKTSARFAMAGEVLIVLSSLCTPPWAFLSAEPEAQ